MLVILSEMQPFNKKELMKERTYSKRPNSVVMELLKKYVPYRPCSFDEVPFHYLKIMKRDFLNSRQNIEEDIRVSCFKIEDTAVMFSPFEDENIILSEENSQLIVSTNNIVQTVILILQGFSSDLDLTKEEIDNAYEEYFKNLNCIAGCNS